MVRPRDVLQATAEVFGLPMEELVSGSRRPRTIEARRVAMFVLRGEAKLSLPEVARELGLRSHATVHRALSLEQYDAVAAELVAEEAAKRARSRLGRRVNAWAQPPVPARWLVASRKAVCGRSA